MIFASALWPLATSSWVDDRRASSAGPIPAPSPARATARKVFSEPVHDRIFLAGEHVHQRYMATAHGAYETGLDAAHKAAAALGFSVGQKDPLWLPT